jgi:Domain of unknown function (DUF1918)
MPPPAPATTIGDHIDRPRGDKMRADVGDRLIVRGHRVGESTRTAEVLEVHGQGGGPPYLVRWVDDGHESLVVPSSDFVVERGRPETASPAPAEQPGEPEPVDPELRILRLEESMDAVVRQLERLREELRALASPER